MLVFKSKSYLSGVALGAVLNLTVFHGTPFSALQGIAFSLVLGQILFRTGILK
jgi:hypothetical protein